MKLLKNLINLKFKKLSIAVGIIAIAGLAGHYSFFNNHVIGQIPDKPQSVSVSEKNNINPSTPLKSHGQTSVDTDAANACLNSKTNEFAEKNDTGNEKLRESPEAFESNDSADMIENMDLQELFKDSVINRHTLGVTEMIQIKFNDSGEDIYSRYGQVEEFLRTQLDDDAKVEEYLTFYKKYNEYEMAQVSDPQSLWLENPENPEEAIRLNTEKQQYQREFFGQEVADKLWGDEAKIHEYKMRELEILREDSYSPQVKEQLIKDLNEKTLGDEIGEQATEMDHNAQLYVKLAIYGEDLMSMKDEERNDKINEFRTEIYPPDKLKFLNFLEGVVETDPEERNHAERSTIEQ